MCFMFELLIKPLISTPSFFTVVIFLTRTVPLLFFFTEKLAVTAKIYQLLEPLDRVQFNSAIAGCVEFCKQHLSADFSPLIEVLQVKNYIVSGDS